jgi:hypothetical protein
MMKCILYYYYLTIDSLTSHSLFRLYTRLGSLQCHTKQNEGGNNANQ